MSLKSQIRDPRLNFLKAQNFYVLKKHQPQPGLNPRTLGLQAST